MRHKDYRRHVGKVFHCDAERDRYNSLGEAMRRGERLSDADFSFWRIARLKLRAIGNCQARGDI